MKDVKGRCPKSEDPRGDEIFGLCCTVAGFGVSKISKDPHASSAVGFDNELAIGVAELMGIECTLRSVNRDCIETAEETSLELKIRPSELLLTTTGAMSFV